MQFIRRHTTVSVFLLLLLAAVGLVIYPVFTRQRGSRIDTCNAHLHVLGVAVRAYTTDYDGRLPNALTWAADLCPDYLETVRFFHCPEDQRQSERSYEMLQRCGYQRLPEAKAARLILLYEIGKYGPEYRHMEGMYVGFGDGHAKWYSPEDMTPETILSGVAPAAKP